MSTSQVKGAEIREDGSWPNSIRESPTTTLEVAMATAMARMKAKRKGKQARQEAYLKIINTDLALGTNNGGSSATPQDWITLRPSSHPWAVETDQFDAGQLQLPPATSPALADLNIRTGIPDGPDHGLLAPSFLFRCRFIVRIWRWHAAAATTTATATATCVSLARTRTLGGAG